MDVVVDVIPGGLVPVIGSALLVLAGGAVRFVREIRPVQVSFSWYMITFGIATGISRFSFTAHAANFAAWTLIGVLSVLGAFALLLTARRQAGPPRSRLDLLLVAIPGAAFLISLTVAVLMNRGTAAETAEFFNLPYTHGFALGWALFSIFIFASYGACAVLATRARTASAEEVGQLAILSNAIALYPGIFVVGFIFYRVPFAAALGYAVLAGTLWLAIIWLVAAERGSAPRSARLAAVAPVAFTLVGTLLGSVLQISASPISGVARIFMVVVLAYAVLRHHALELDIRLRWGISKSTLAAMFVAIVFLASEGAQLLFGNPLLGLVAGGLLVFVLTPLSRLADRIADRAVPRRGGATPEGPVHAYENMVRRFLRDGQLDDDEEYQLAQLAQELGIGAVDALRIRRGVKSK